MNFFTNEAMGIGNSGVEHAEFYRARLFKRVGLPYKFIFVNLIENLHEAMDKWNLAPNDVINMWEYFVLGDEYALNGLQSRQTREPESVLVDSTQTNRLIRSVTNSGMRVIKHLIKAPDPDKPEMLLVSVQRIDLLENSTGEKKVSYELLTEHRQTVVKNVHLYNQGHEETHLFFPNEVQVKRYFFKKISQLYGNKNVFIIDRGEAIESALMDHNDSNDKLVGVIHADHLSDRQDPQNPFWNNYYEYELAHLNRLNALVVATKMQRKDLLIDFPNDSKKIKAIPVGGVDDKIVFKTRSALRSPLRLITMSRLAEEKHIDLVLRAVIHLHNTGNLITLDVYGGGGERGKLERIIEDNKAQKFIKLQGQTNHPADVYQDYDAFISGSFSEGFGLTYIEALNSGLPVITFDARFGAQEIITDGENGFIQPFNRNNEHFNIKQLVKGIKRLQTADYNILQKNIKALLQPYQEQNIAEMWRSLIDEL